MNISRLKDMFMSVHDKFIKIQIEFLMNISWMEDETFFTNNWKNFSWTFQDYNN